MFCRVHCSQCCCFLEKKAATPEQALEAPNLLHSLSQQDRFGSAEAQYNVSKLFGMYAINELAAKATGEEGTENVIINSVNPGATATSLALRIVAFVYLRLLARVVEQCSYSLVSACTFGMESHSRYWEHDRFLRKFCSSDNLFLRESSYAARCTAVHES